MEKTRLCSHGSALPTTVPADDPVSSTFVYLLANPRIMFRAPVCPATCHGPRAVSHVYLSPFAHQHPSSCSTLDREMSSAAKLNNQGVIMSNAMGGPIKAPVSLEDITAVLDAATGIAGWLFEVAPLLPQASELHGIDISDTKFPRPSEAGERPLLLETADLTKPLPKKYHAKFDLINVRHLFGWLDYRKWDDVYSNLFAALKPGGYIQVLDTRMTIEADFAQYYPRIKKAFGLDAEEQVAIAKLLPKLPAHLPSLGFTNATQTIYPLLYGKLQPDSATREAGMLQMLGAARGFQARGFGATPSDGERLSTVMEGVTYVVPGNTDEWEVFIEESKKAFEEVGWALPLRVTIAQRPL
ncbi:S-adenosyl-L-methionine-dependent methyltransferase [Mycena venus]|uniref:S-adenosyl-L-methionine-dependent methyltransferase n=1 Tax=Mycena venus TaxID=2733690 RepID=A0A8H6YL82_9AGAR|nr:S-adenosyl-L-methionine-dependent methyltransferase [Mycena venus]